MAYLGPVFRWDVLLADLEPAIGREQKGDARPVVVVSNNFANRVLDVFTVLPLTKLEGKGRDPHPFEVAFPIGFLDPGVTPLALPQQIRTISKMRLLEKVGVVRDEALQMEIEDRILDHLGIDLITE